MSMTIHASQTSNGSMAKSAPNDIISHSKGSSVSTHKGARRRSAADSSRPRKVSVAPCMGQYPFQ